MPPPEQAAKPRVRNIVKRPFLAIVATSIDLKKNAQIPNVEITEKCNSIRPFEQHIFEFSISSTVRGPFRPLPRTVYGSWASCFPVFRVLVF